MPEINRDRLAKVLELLASSHDGEALAAARRAAAMVKASGVQWAGVLEVGGAAPIMVEVGGGNTDLAYARGVDDGFKIGREEGLKEGLRKASAGSIEASDVDCWELLRRIRRDRGVPMPAGIRDPMESGWSVRERAYVNAILEVEVGRECRGIADSSPATAAGPARPAAAAGEPAPKPKDESKKARASPSASASASASAKEKAKTAAKAGTATKAKAAAKPKSMTR